MPPTEYALLPPGVLFLQLNLTLDKAPHILFRLRLDNVKHLYGATKVVSDFYVRPRRDQAVRSNRRPWQTAQEVEEPIIVVRLFALV
jgi:hypothetical protein